MFGQDFKKAGYFLNWLRFRVGELFFPILEPIFQWWENREKDVRGHFYQGLKCLDQKKTAIALLNLNMVLSLKPGHFQALVCRGRLYLKEGRGQLAAEDFLKANKVSPYRFTHHDLHREYFQSVNKDVENLGASIVNNFTDALESLSQSKDTPVREQDTIDQASLSKKRSAVEQTVEEDEDDAVPFKRLYLNDQEREKFRKLGPITQQEIKDTDWDQLIQDLTP
ncbi:hypothetical protein UR09_00675 [Candidatus Nitromaritima sp. SCGC AAA799-A02]|nr:hypothetical protein UR09_00675 [Candidatus Nitromaritima sp. SCGC AAA799-A02]